MRTGVDDHGFSAFGPSDKSLVRADKRQGVALIDLVSQEELRVEEFALAGNDDIGHGGVTAEESQSNLVGPGTSHSLGSKIVKQSEGARMNPRDLPLDLRCQHLAEGQIVFFGPGLGVGAIEPPRKKADQAHRDDNNDRNDADQLHDEGPANPLA